MDINEHIRLSKNAVTEGPLALHESKADQRVRRANAPKEMTSDRPTTPNPARLDNDLQGFADCEVVQNSSSK